MKLMVLVKEMKPGRGGAERVRGRDGRGAVVVREGG